LHVARRGTRGTALGCALLLCTALAAGLTAGPAAAVPDADPPPGALVAATAAATGAGDAATEALAETAAGSMVELGRVAADVEVPGPKKPKPPAVLAHSRWSWQGWSSGAAGAEAENGSFATWRGEPLGVVGVWCDTSAQEQQDLSAVATYNGFHGDLDVAVGGLVTGETWQQAAAGDFVDRWTTSVRNLRAMRQGKGVTYIRFAHEMNGDWFAWSVTSATLASYKTAYRLYASIVRKEFPEARLTWSPNGGNHADATADQMYPGDDVVDVIGPDIYDGYPEATTAAAFNEASAMWSDSATPRGLAAWQAYAARKGKPIALPEWGLPYGDHPEFIKGVHAVVAAHAATAGSSMNAGRFVYDVYYNVEDKFKIYNGQLVQAGAAYKALTWGS